MEKRLIVLSSPSGGGKSTIARKLMKDYPDMMFSISATTRKRRPKETYGIEYFFLSREEFKRKIKNGEFVEYEEIFGNYYGTLKNEIRKALDIGCAMLFDIDVKGALSIKRAFPDDALLIFIAPPSVDVLRKRLTGRGTESEEEIVRRLQRAGNEMSQSSEFDYVVVNDDLEKTYNEILGIVKGCVE